MIELESASGFCISVLPYAATWASCRVPLGDGTRREVLLGCASEDDYRSQRAYLGASIGRFANRIGQAGFSLGERAHALERNDGEHCLHGGWSGFGRRHWTIEELAVDRARLAIVSADGEGGFPGRMSAEIRYSVDAEGSAVSIEFLAAVDRPCPVSLTNHAYFNLDGDGVDCRRHRLRLASDRFLAIDDDGIPDGTIAGVGGTPFDFRRFAALDSMPDDHPQMRASRGYNHAFILDGQALAMLRPAAELISTDGLLLMQMFTTMPAVHVYGGNFLAGTPSRSGHPYGDYAGIALEAEFPPDSPNHPEWPTPDCILQPGSVYRHAIRFQFAAIEQKSR
jgi:aldose 1-epimerase